MSKKYIRNMDEDTLAWSLDETRKANCNCDQGCTDCPWSMGDQKCLLITAENHISDRWRMRYRNLMKHYGKVNDFIMNDVYSMELYCGGRLTHSILHGNTWGLLYHGIMREFTAVSALNLVNQIEANRELIEDEIDELRKAREEKDEQEKAQQT